MSSPARESSDTSDDLSDSALKTKSGDVSLPNGIPASDVNCAKDVSSLKFLLPCEC